MLVQVEEEETIAVDVERQKLEEEEDRDLDMSNWMNVYYCAEGFVVEGHSNNPESTDIVRLKT